MDNRGAIMNQPIQITPFKSYQVKSNSVRFYINDQWYTQSEIEEAVKPKSCESCNTCKYLDEDSFIHQSSKIKVRNCYLQKRNDCYIWEKDIYSHSCSGHEPKQD